MTDTNVPDAEGVDWGGMQAPDGRENQSVPDIVPSRAFPLYPEYPDNPHNHRFTVSITPDKPPMIVVRGNTAAEITAAFQELEDFGVYANTAAAYASLKAQGAIGAGLGPVTAMPPQAAPPGLPGGPVAQLPPGAYAPQGPTTPPPFGPNVSVPQAPGYQGPPQGYAAAPPPQGGGWGGQQGGNPNEKPRPAGWAMVDVPFNDKDRFKGLRAQGTETGNYLRGKIQWGGKGVYWLEPSIAGWIAQQGFPVTQ